MSRSWRQSGKESGPTPGSPSANRSRHPQLLVRWCGPTPVTHLEDLKRLRRGRWRWRLVELQQVDLAQAEVCRGAILPNVLECSRLRDCAHAGVGNHPGERHGFVKAFNTSFAGPLLAEQVDGEPLDVFIAGDDQEAKATVTELVFSRGMRAIDAGRLAGARELEAMALVQMAIQGTRSTRFASAIKVMP
jgi:hypothetical protein